MGTNVIFLFPVIIKPSDLEAEGEKQRLLHRGDLMARMFLPQFSQENLIREKVTYGLGYLPETKDCFVFPLTLQRAGSSSRGTIRLNR